MIERAKTQSRPARQPSRRAFGSPSSRVGCQGSSRSANRGSDWLAVIPHGDVSVMKPASTRLVCSQLDGLAAVVRRLVEVGARKLVIDLQAVNDIDGACIGRLVEAHCALRDSGGTLRLTSLHPWVRTMVEMAGIARVVPVDDDLTAALASLRARGAGSLQSVCAVG